MHKMEKKIASRDRQSRDANLEILCEIVSRSRKNSSRCPRHQNFGILLTVENSVLK